MQEFAARFGEGSNFWPKSCRQIGATEGSNFGRRHEPTTVTGGFKRKPELNPLPCDAGFDFFVSERAMGSRKKHHEVAADLESREGFDMVLPFK